LHAGNVVPRRPNGLRTAERSWSAWSSVGVIGGSAASASEPLNNLARASTLARVLLCRAGFRSAVADGVGFWSPCVPVMWARADHVLLLGQHTSGSRSRPAWQHAIQCRP